MTTDPRRSYGSLDVDDLARLGRLGALEVEEFFARNPALGGWQGQQRFIALVQGGAEHYPEVSAASGTSTSPSSFAQHSDFANHPYLRRGTASGTGVLRSSAAVRSTTRTTKAGQST